jgi:glucosylceramidase
MADRFVRCTAHACDRLPPTDSDDPSSAVVFSSVLHSDNSASFLQRSVTAFERVDEGEGGGGADELLIDSQSAQEGEHVLLGFGGAFTDAAADAFASVPAGLQAQILRQYFGPDGIGYRLGRVPIGGTDFSTRAYTYADGAAGDLALRNFSLAADERHKLPLLHAALALSPELELIASPWSAPAWMKDSGSLVWGALKGEPGGPYYRAWATYLCRFISEYAARGVRVRWLTVQNEPTFSLVTRFTVRWNSMALSAERMRDFVKLDLGPALAAAHPGVGLLLHDDQRDELVRVTSVVMADAEAARYVVGAGFHWYDTMAWSWAGWAGIDWLRSWEAVAQVHARWPQLTLIGTEAAEGFQPWSQGPQLGSWVRLETYAYDILRDLAAGARGWMDWNLLLRSDGGENWAGNQCDAPLLLTPELDGFVKQPIFYALAHFARFLPPGSRRLAQPSGSGAAAASVNFVAYLTPNRRVAAVLLNKDAAERCVRLRDVRRGVRATLCLPPRSLHTVVWHADAVAPASTNPTRTASSREAQSDTAG